MSSVRLRTDQIARLRKSGNAAAIIRYAVKRWKRGDFAIADAPPEKNERGCLHVFPIWRKVDGVADWQLREILDRHWIVRDEERARERDREIARLDREIAEMMKLLPPVVIEGDMEL